MDRFIIYVFRWILSGLIMYPLMQLLSPYVSLWFNILIGQIFGACIFYYVDKRIFR